MQEAQAPSGQVPQYLVVSEIQRRTDMRKRYQEQQQPQGTVADQIVQEAAGGIASMPPQGMPPQGMPPQGAPQQAMPPQAMPPQQMFSGGIIRLQKGGSTGMPGEYALAALMEKAKDIARIAGRKVEDVYEILVRQAQENMPDYGMIMPSGVGDLPSVDLEPFQRAAQETPLGDLATNIADAVFDAREYGAVPAYAAGLREGITGALPAFGKTAYQGLKELGGAALDVVPEEVPELVAMPFNEAAKGVGTLITGDPSVDPLGSLGRSLGSSLYDIFEGSGDDERAEAGAESGLDPAESDVPVLTEAIVTAQRLTNDASKKRDGVAGSREVQGRSPIQSQALPGDKTEPGLDFADLIADAKKAGMANALMQLGAGIAGGDLSKGISAAGVAATKGQQAAKDMAIKQRLATYAAGREDQAREEKAKEFKKTFGLSERKVNALIEQNADTTQREILRTLVSLYEGEPNPDKKAGYAQQIQDMLKEIQGLSVDYGLTPGFNNNDPAGIRS